MLIGLLISLVSFNAWALDCSGIPEGQVVRIDQNNGSLAKAAVQDQDGVGSCYANQASLLLQSVIPGNPNLSYLNLGLYYTADKDLPETRKQGDLKYTRDRKNSDGTITPESGSAISGGFACDTIEAALSRQKTTKAGAVCKAEDVALEHSFFTPEGSFVDTYHEQEKTLTQASRYMNTYQKTFGYAFSKNESDKLKMQKQREEADKFGAALSTFVKDSSDTYFSEKCSKLDPDKLEKILENAQTRALGDNPDCLAGSRIKATTLTCKSFDQLGYVTTTTTGNSSKINFILGGSFRQKAQKEFPSIYNTDAGIEGVVANIANFYKKNNAIKSTPAQKEAFAKMIAAHISPEDMKTLEGDYKRITLKDIGECKAANVLNYFKDKDNFVEKAKKDVVLCNYSELLNRASDLAGVLPSNKFNDMSSFLNFLTTKAGLNYDTALLSLIANDCTPEKRLKIPETLKCEKERILFEESDFANNQMSSKAVDVIKRNRAKMFSNLQNNRGIGLDICTKFWKEPTYDFHKESSTTKYASCASSGTHGFHAITMIGYRCKNNKVEYLAQNSWGPNWHEDAYEIENGKIWLDESQLFKNLDNIDYISQ